MKSPPPSASGRRLPPSRDCASKFADRCRRKRCIEHRRPGQAGAGAPPGASRSKCVHFARGPGYRRRRDAISQRPRTLAISFAYLRSRHATHALFDATVRPSPDRRWRHLAIAATDERREMTSATLRTRSDAQMVDEQTADRSSPHRSCTTARIACRIRRARPMRLHHLQCSTRTRVGAAASISAKTTRWRHIGH